MIVPAGAVRKGSCALGAVLSVALARAGDVTVLHSDARSVQIEYRARYAPQASILAGGTQYMKLEFDGGKHEVTGASAGGPDLSYRYIPVAFPGPSGNTLRVITSEYEELHDALLAPVPKPVRKAGAPASLVYEADPARYGRAEFVPGTVAELAPVGRVRDMYLGGVKVMPVQFNPAARTVRRYTRVVVEVTFGAPGAPLPKRGTDQILKDVAVNYSVARTWAGTALRSAAAPVPSVLASGDWFRLTVTAEGMYRLDASYLSSLGINVSAIDPRTIRIFGNGGREVPENIGAPRPVDLQEDAIYVSGESDGKFDAGDFVAFYGRGARGWSYDPAGKTLRHYIHDYSEVNYYWLTYGGAQGKRMVSQPSLASSATDLLKDTFTDGIALEEERTNLLLSSLVGGEGSGRQWFGQQVNSGSSFTYVNNLPGLVPTGSIIYRYALAGQADNSPAFTVSESGTPIGFAPLYPSGGYTVADEQVFQVSGKSSLAGNTSRLTFAFSGQGVAPAGWIDWFEIFYPRTLSAVNDSLRFYGPDTTAVVEYHLQGFSGTPAVFNVTSHENVRLVTGLGGSFLFRAAEVAGGSSAYWAVAGNSWRTPSAAVRMPNENIRGYAGGADFIIVTASQYRPGADRLAAYRADPAHGGMKVYVADVGQIYDEFSGGLADVTAIRDFLKFAYDTWSPSPRFVLMMGQASFDYKGILGTQSSFVPTWETPESLDDLASFGTDDFYGKFGGTDVPSLVIGRVSARTGAEADAFVDKLMHYENSSAADGWKMRMLFIGDDAWTPEDGEAGNGTIHSDAAETLSRPPFTPPEFETRKIYLAEYPTVFTAAGRRKPGAYQAIIDQVNQGVLVVNFAGHGNPVQLSNNDVFDVATSVPQLVNLDRLSVFFLATCNFSEFDDPLNRTASEILINKPDGGAIGVVSADRKVFAGENAALNQGTYLAMFGRDVYGRLVVERPATALFAYKVSGGNGPNDQKYSYLGDPTMRFQFPRGYASFDSINGSALDSAGIPLSTVLQLRSLSRVSVAGSIRDAANRVDAAYNGRVQVTLNDASRTQTIVNFYPGYNWSYVATGGLLYRGENSVQNGKFTATFVVPKDIQYSDSLSRGRLVAYVFRQDAPSSDAEAYTGSVHIGGTDSSAVNPGTGPSVSIYLGNRSFRRGDLVNENPLLLVDLADSSGINTSTSGVGHRIEAWVNNASQSTDLTGFYTSKLNSFREGTVQYQLSDLPEGKNTIRVRAWNSFDNSGSAETAFEVAAGGQLTVSDVFNYPNPFGASGTEFTFRQNQSSPLNVTVKIFTVAGRLIRTLETFAPGDSFVSIPWDGRDRDGDVIANGVYLYKLIVRTADGRFTSESLSKLSKIQ